MATSPSPYDPSRTFAPSGEDYHLKDLGLMKKTPSSQAFAGQGSHHQHGLSSVGKVPDIVAGKKARFVSDSNIPSVLGMGFGTTAPPATQGFGNGHQTQQAESQPYTHHHHQQSLQHHPHHHHQQQASRTAFESIAANGSLGAGQNHDLSPPVLGGVTSGAGGVMPNRSVSSTFALGPPSLGGSNGLASHQPTSPYAHSAAAFPSPLNIPNSAATYASGMSGVSQSAAPFLLNASTSPMFSPGFPPGANFMANAGMPGVPLMSSNVPANQTGRTVYVGNLPAEASVDELFNQVKFGPIENVRVLPEKNCAFISFLDGATAASFHADASVKKLSLHGQELKIGWGRPSAVPTAVLMAVQQNQATRNVYVQLGQDDKTTEETLRDDLSRFGPIDQVKIVRDKNIGFVHFLSIATAMKVVSQLPQEAKWAGKRVNYGKDRCAYVPKSQQQNQAHNNQAAAMSMAAAASLGYPTAFAFAGLPTSAPAAATAFSRNLGDDLSGIGPSATALEQLGNRTVYLGNIHPETTTEEICNHIRGGILQTVRYIPEKHIAFVTFVDANSALAFNHLASYSGVMIHNRRLKIGWGKHSGALSPAIAMAVQAGCSRNVYIGNIEDPEFLTEEKLRHDFSEHGDVELVNSLREKNCAFVNFCNIQNAIKAIEAMKSHPDYQSVKISHGKDRCGRTMQFNHNGGGFYRKPSGNLSPNRTASSQRKGNHGTNAEADGDLTATAPSESGNAGGADLSRSSSAHDMPPIDSASTLGGLSPLPALRQDGRASSSVAAS
ncbi:unnamed protein product [Parajaminaea phylloscopi]